MSILISYLDTGDALINNTLWSSFNINIPGNGDYSNIKVVHSFTPMDAYLTNSQGITTPIAISFVNFNKTQNITVSTWTKEYSIGPEFLYKNILEKFTDWYYYPEMTQQIDNILTTDIRQKQWDSARFKVLAKTSTTTSSNGGTGSSGGTGGTGSSGPIVLKPKLSNDTIQLYNTQQQDWLNFIASGQFDLPEVQKQWPNNIPRISVPDQLSWYKNMITPRDAYTRTMNRVMLPRWNVFIGKIVIE